MQIQDYTKKPTKEDQLAAMASYDAFESVLASLKTDTPEIEIEETEEKIRIPLSVLKLLAKILKATAEGKPVSIVPIATEMTTQAAAEIMGCSRPHVIKLLDEGKIAFTKVGRHRRIKIEDIMEFKRQEKEKQKALLIKLMKVDQESGLYDT